MGGGGNVETPLSVVSAPSVFGHCPWILTQCTYLIVYLCSVRYYTPPPTLSTSITTTVQYTHTHKLHQLFEVAQEGHLAWSCPLSMIVVSIFLVLIMGPSTLVGVFVLFVLVPIVKRVATTMLRIRHERAKLSDERVEVVTAMLQGVSLVMLDPDTHMHTHTDIYIYIYSYSLAHALTDTAVLCPSMSLLHTHTHTHTRFA